jgi:hypothetical protein
MRLLLAGPLCAQFDRGNIRYVRWGGCEVLRAIAFIIRDTRWGTYDPFLSEPETEESAGRFTIRYRAECSGKDGAFRYSVEITGSADGMLDCHAWGESDHGFDTNRTGFVVLHPLDGVVGRDVAIRHASGGTSIEKFPELIDPKQPVFDIRELRHEPMPGVTVSVRMEGDTFEMEDHRNWTDASFKTYVRPLARGFPYQIGPGESLDQRVTLRIEGHAPPKRAPARFVTVNLGGPQDPMPKIGLFLPGADINKATDLTSRLAVHRPGYLLARIDARGDLAEAARLAQITRLVGRPLSLDIVIPGKEPQAEIAPVADIAERHRLRPEAVFVMPSRDLRSRPANQTPAGESAPEEILSAARQAFPSAQIGGGMPTAFTELNRNHPPAGIDFVTHATQAIGHAADDVSVMETLETLPHVIRSVRAIVGNIPYRVALATIGAPEEFFSTAPLPNPQNRRVPMAAEDPRQRGLFAAAFALGYVAKASGINAITLAASSGPAGLVAADGRRYPIAAIFEGLANLTGRARIETTITKDAKIAAVAADCDDGPVLWLANLAGAPVEAKILGRTFRNIRQMDAEALTNRAPDRIETTSFTGDIVNLDAYAVCCLT